MPVPCSDTPCMQLPYRTPPMQCQPSSQFRFHLTHAAMPHACPGTADGSWLLVQGSTQGLLTKHLNASRAAAPTSSAQHPASTLAKGAGVLGALGSALSWGYAEVFDPSAKLVKRTPCGRPVADIHVAALDAGRLRVTLLTDVSVECWMVKGL